MENLYNDDWWDNKYIPLPNQVTKEGESAQLYETYGQELEYVLKVANSEPYRVWTMVEGDDDKLLIVQGYHLVNRIGYYITEKSWEENDPTEFLIDI